MLDNYLCHAFIVKLNIIKFETKESFSIPDKS